MSIEKKIDLIINVLGLVPFVAQGLAEASATFNKLMAALKDGNVSDDEMKSMMAERDAVIERLIAKTASTEPPSPAPAPAPEDPS